jgi:histone acetyltransferase 1
MSALPVEEENKKTNNCEEKTMEMDQDEPSLKKQKVVSFSAAIDILPPPPPLATSDEEEEATEAAEPTWTLAANECIRLVMVDYVPDTKEFVYHSFRPEYTHQLFENEEIVLPIAPPTLASDPHLLTVFIRCSDLAHTVVVENSTTLLSDTATETLVLNQLKTGLPDDTTTRIINYRTAAGGGQTALPASFLDPRIFQSDPLGSHRTSLTVDQSLYDLYLASNKDVPASWTLLRRAEKVAMWHIETADAVDFADERWEVINLYKSGTTVGGDSGSTCRSLAGYITLFTFLNPFKGLKMRVCQALVLPHVQKQGLGREMLLGVYRLAAERENVCEVTVEDPCPGFERMRDTVDCEWLLLALTPKAAANAESWLQLVAGQDRATYPKRLKLTPAQTNFAFEAVQYTLLHQQQEQQEEQGGGDDEAKDDQQLRQFRLQVKRRLLGDNAHIKAGGKEAMQKELEALYGEMAERFERCRKHCVRVMGKIDAQLYL